jgi:hypothetical protein
MSRADNGFTGSYHRYAVHAQYGQLAPYRHNKRVLHSAGDEDSVAESSLLQYQGTLPASQELP